MQNQKPKITEKKRRGNLIANICTFSAILLYVGLRWGYFYKICEVEGEMPLFSSISMLTENFLSKPWQIYPTHWFPVGLMAIVSAVIGILMYNKYLVLKDTVEDAHGTAAFEENYDQYEREFVCDPEIIGKMMNIKMDSKNCPRNEEGKKVFTDLKTPYSSPGKFKKAVDECRRMSMIYTDTICLSLSGSWAARNANSIVFGASGTGKSRYFLKPNILQDNGSFICTDPSGRWLCSVTNA